MDLQKVLISTLICTYNAENFFDFTIKSVINQTYENQEILIRDDGSTDGTIDLLYEWAKKDNRIKLFIEPGVKKGPYGGLNYLLDKAVGKYIAIQDHDDLWHPKKLEKQVNFLLKNPLYQACGTYYLFWLESFDRFRKISSLHHEHKIIPWHCSIVFKKTSNRYDTEMSSYNDYDFMLRLGKIGIVPEYYMIHRVRSDNKNLSSIRGKNWKNIIIQLKKTGLKGLKYYTKFFLTFVGLLLGPLTPYVSLYFVNRKKFFNRSVLLSEYPEYKSYLD